ncbi:type II CAAX prenyl endopeptidase Rce1 family protein, partial [Coprococcus eutactus]|uniref:CPBP family glutamic-type intramembrane protease n=1 Tax=Coprococcus eutactus TaxID=33043 RepID=UPI003A7F5D9C
MLFGVFHGKIIQFCYALPAGILLAILTDWSASLTPAIILHIIRNKSSYLVSGNDTASLLLTSLTAY